jgi:GNAT superfamily N-acetyltransferase
LEELFSLPLENYRVATVTILQDVDRPVRIVGEIRNANKRVGFVGMKVPSVPPLGSPWVAKVEVINVDPKHQRLGIGSRLHVRAARFLHDRGVHAMDADAMEDAGLFCVFNGFRVDRAIYEDVVAEFVEDMRRAEVEVTEDLIRTQLLHPDANLAELAALKDIKGRGIGREFLKGLFSKRYLPVRFGLSPDNMSWLRLLSNLHRDGPSRKIAPLEWESLQPATRERLISNVDFVGGNVPNLMSSDREHAFHLLERLTNWVQRFSLLLFFPPAMQGPMLEEMREEIEDNMAAAQDVLKMIAADTSSPLFSHFRHLMDPGKDEGINRGDSTNNGLPMAATLLAAEKREFLRLPSVLRAFFDDLVTRDY